MAKTNEQISPASGDKKRTAASAPKRRYFAPKKAAPKKGQKNQKTQKPQSQKAKAAQAEKTAKTKCR